MAAHAVHFTVVARYAVVNGGRDLFPGGRSLRDVGGWRTVVGIYSFFAGLAVTGWVTDAPLVARRPRWHAIGHAATWVMAAMFVGVYLGQLPRSRWYAVPATAVAGAMVADGLARRLRYFRRSTRPSSVVWCPTHGGHQGWAMCCTRTGGSALSAARRRSSSSGPVWTQTHPGLRCCSCTVPGVSGNQACSTLLREQHAEGGGELSGSMRAICCRPPKACGGR